MNPELKTILDELKALIDDWNSRKIPKEEELIGMLKKISARLTEELKKPQSVQKTV